jgi:hypothetical protein
MNYDEVMSVQYGGNHYKDRKIQPWEVWEAYDMNGWEASAVKYLMRWKDKGKPLEDLYKALHNVQYLIAKEERKQHVQAQKRQGQSAKIFENLVQGLQQRTFSTSEVYAEACESQIGGTSTDVRNS